MKKPKRNGLTAMEKIDLKIIEIAFQCGFDAALFGDISENVQFFRDKMFRECAKAAGGKK